MDEAEIEKWNAELISSILVGGNLQQMKLSLDNGADANSKSGNGRSALICAINSFFNRTTMVKILVTRGADINAFDEHTKDIPLNYAIRNATEVAEYLIYMGANVCKAGKDGNTPLDWAARKQNLELIELLLDHNAKFTIHSALFEALDTENIEIIQALMKKAADVNILYRNGYTLLLRAIELNNIDIVRELVENGADVNVSGRNGETPLLKSIKMGNTEIMKQVMMRKVNVNAKDHKGNHPIMVAIEIRNLEIVRLLIENGADLTIQDIHGNSPFFKTVLTENLEMVKYFVKLGEDVNAIDSKGETPLIIAAKLMDIRSFDFLFKSGAKIDKYVEKIKTLAKENENFEIYLNSLLKHSANGNNGQEDAFCWWLFL